MVRLIINGDDFGMNESCTSAIAQAVGEGLITDTTMMANGDYFDEAAALAKQKGFSDRIGVHFNLTEGEPLTDGIRKLAAFVSDGVFHKGFLRCPHPLSDAEQKAVFAELSAQIERIEQAGIRITHADSHHYIHNLTFLAPIVAQACKEHGVGKIRLNRTFDTPSHPCVIENRTDNAFWRENGFVTAKQFGRLSDLRQIAIPDLTAIMVHPDFDRDGRLIDRTAVIDGFPAGEPLDGKVFKKISAGLICYADLVEQKS